MNRSYLLTGLLSLALLAGCNDDTTDADAPDTGQTPAPDTSAGVDTTEPGADTALPDVVAPDVEDIPGPLRPNVQEGQTPNAVGQQPAFPEQTRAPQPAQDTAFTTEVIASGLQIPWGIAPLPDGRLLVTERVGRLRLVSMDGSVSEPIGGVPDVAAVGQGGLLDVAVSPDFATDRAVFLTYSESRGASRLAPAVARGFLSDDGSQLENVSVIYRQEPALSEGRHFGSRIAFRADGTLFVTFGDRGSAFDEAQSPFSSIGAVIRIEPDGGIPDDNPFADGTEGEPAVWSWGHRNIQSATIGTDGLLWTVEHGARGGDELNQPQPGRNYGWPAITYGQDYSGRPVGEGATSAPGMEQPVYFWDPVIAPSDLLAYTGELFPGWRGDLLIGGLQSQSIVRLTLRDGQVRTEEWLPIGARVRSLALAADGAVLVGTDSGDILALRPE